MSGRRQRIETGVTNGIEKRPGTASAQLTARLSARNGALLGSTSVPLMETKCSPAKSRNQLENQMSDNPLPVLRGVTTARPGTCPGVMRTSFSSAVCTPILNSTFQKTPQSRGRVLTPKNGKRPFKGGKMMWDTMECGPSSTSPTPGIPLGLNKLCNGDLEIYVNLVRKQLELQADFDSEPAMGNTKVGSGTFWHLLELGE
ncbi:unnamed protein product [Choristocarpus tenellus]